MKEQEQKEAKVIGGRGHNFKVGEIVTLVRETTSDYYGEYQEIEERYYLFVNKNGYEQDLSDDEDFVWL